MILFNRVFNFIKSVLFCHLSINKNIKDTEQKINELDLKLQEMETMIAALKTKNEIRKIQCVACYKKAFKQFDSEDKEIKAIPSNV